MWEDARNCLALRVLTNSLYILPGSRARCCGRCVPLRRFLIAKQCSGAVLPWGKLLAPWRHRCRVSSYSVFLRLGGAGLASAVGDGVVKQGITRLWKVAMLQAEASCLGNRGELGSSSHCLFHLCHLAMPDITVGTCWALTSGGVMLSDHQSRGRDTSPHWTILGCLFATVLKQSSSTFRRRRDGTATSPDATSSGLA